MKDKSKKNLNIGLNLAHYRAQTEKEKKNEIQKSHHTNAKFNSYY